MKYIRRYEVFQLADRFAYELRGLEDEVRVVKGGRGA